MDIGNKILTVYSARYTPDNSKIKAGDIWLQNGQNPYKIYDGSEWQAQTGTKSSELKEIFSEDENYFYVNYNANPNIEFVKKYTSNGWEDITNSRTGQLLKIAADVEAVADGKISTYSGDFSNERAAIAPNPDEGDLFIDTANQNKLYRYSYIEGTGFNWVAADDERLVGEGSGINFVPTGATNGSIILNKANGLKITNNNGAYFQATHNKMGFYTSNGTALMQISGGNAYFSGTISASTISASTIYAANFTSSQGDKITFGGVANSGFYADTAGSMHVKNLTIDSGCCIGDGIIIDAQGFLKNIKDFMTTDTYIKDNEIYILMAPAKQGISLQATYRTDNTNFSSYFGTTLDEGHMLQLGGGDGDVFRATSKDGITVAKFSNAVYADIANHIGSGGSGGSVTITNRLTSGTRICTINSTDIYAPSITVNAIQNSGTQIATINGTSIYAPSSGSVTITNRLTSGTRICTINSTDIYAPSSGGGSISGGTIVSGVVEFGSVSSGSYTDKTISFSGFTSTPVIVATIRTNAQTAPADLGNCTVYITTKSTTGATLRFANKDTHNRSPYVEWIAFGS